MAWNQETLNVIGRTLLDEFSDLSDIEQGTRITLRLILAALLGGLLGLEREQQGKEAGVRTHMWSRSVQRCLCWYRISVERWTMP